MAAGQFLRVAVPKEQELFESIVGDLYEGALDDAAWERALTGLARLVGGEGPLLISINPTTGQLRRFECFSYDPEIVARYLSEWLPYDMRIQGSLKIPLLEPFTEAQTVGIRQWQRSPIFNEFLYRNDCAWTLNSTLHRQDDKATALAIQATRSRGPFAPEDLDIVRPLLRHVYRALEIKDRFEVTQVHQRTVATCLDTLSLAVLLLDEAGRLMEASERALEILRSDSGIRRNADGTVWLRGSAGSDLNEWITKGLPPAHNGDGMLHVQRPMSRPLSVMVTRLPAATASWFSGRGLPCWMLLMFDPDRRVPASAERIARDLGVSVREAELAALLANGYDLRLIAQRLNISVNTARTHLKSIFSKTGIRSQGELIGRIAYGPGGVPSRQ